MFSLLPTLPSQRALFDILTYYVLFRVLKWSLKPWSSPSPLRYIPGPAPESWFKGNLGQLFNAKGLPFHLGLGELYGGMAKVHGFFGHEQLYISDPKALQDILIKNPDAWEETEVFIETNRIIFGPGLVSTTGDVHKRQRKLVNPVFSPTNLRNLVPTFYGVAERLTDVLTREIRSRAGVDGFSVLDMSEWMSRAALETVGQTVLGYSFDPLDSPVNNAYTSAIRELIPTLFSLSLVRQFAPFLVRLGPAWMRRRFVDWTPNLAVQKVKDMSDVMHNTAVKILADARVNIRQQSKKTLISLLLSANDTAGRNERLSEAELAGQLTVMVFGAQDTSSSALSRLIYQLSVRPDIQDNIRKEIRAAGAPERHLTIEEIFALPWLDAVLKETLRLYPPVPFVRRTALQECTVHFGHDSSVTIPQGTIIFLGIAGANRLPSVWGPHAKEWKPERWLVGDVHHKVDSSVHLPGIYAEMMSFLGGKRSCIGYRFAQIEIKILLISLISRFEILPSEDDVVWNLSQIISASVRIMKEGVEAEEKGLPLRVKVVD
ncbi:cytochrome P450 [Mycena alexandri]|uniref:Cytochrome P450 n=1 Tax=Mycena alexandri TaxID=1745969 RepID=A0AAD6SIB3_9AGAR|nr:cytochrome P450 [Mycena alexandri]